MLELEVLVVELVAVDARAARAIALDEIATLDHEALDRTVKAGALVADWFASLAELTRAELPARVWHQANEHRAE